MTDLNPRRVDDLHRITEALAAAPFAMLRSEYERRLALDRVGRCPDCRKWLGDCRCERAAVPAAPLREAVIVSDPDIRAVSRVREFNGAYPDTHRYDATHDTHAEPSRVAVADAVNDYDDRNC